MIPAAQVLRSWRENPCKFVHDNFKPERGIDKWQEKALMLFPSQRENEKRLALQACVGPGKSAVLAWMGWNFLSCYGETNNHPKGAAVSITADNLKDNLWPEFSKWQQRSDFLKTTFEWTKEKIFYRKYPETWFMSARSYSKKANAEDQGKTLSGLHSKFVLVLLDETGEMPVAVGKAGDQIMATNAGPNQFKKIVQAGNPSSLDGILYAAVVEAVKLWTTIRITGDPDDSDRSPAIDKSWAKEQVDLWGRDNPWIMSSILGLFPPSSINSLIGADEVQSAMERHLREDEYSWSQKRIGLDAARFGGDPWCLFRRQGLASFPIIKMRNPRTPDVAARVMNEINKWGGDVRVFADGTGGFGAGAIDALLQAEQPCEEIHFSGAPIDPRFLNKRTEMIWEFVDWVKRGGALALDSNLKKQLVKSTYTFKKGKIWMMEKEQFKKLNNGESCDELDSGALTFAQPDMAGDLGGRVPSKAKQEYARPPKPHNIFGDLEGAVDQSYGSSSNQDDVREAGKF